MTDDDLFRLVDAALHAEGGETRDGGLVDHYLSYADNASMRLRDRCKQRSLEPELAEFVRRAMRNPRESVEMVTRMVDHLREWLGPVIEELLGDPSPHARAMAVRAAPLRGPVPVHLVPRLVTALEDPDPVVRREAGARIPFMTDRDARGALLGRIDRETDRRTRAAMIAQLAQSVRFAAGGSRRRAELVQKVGADTRALLLRELGHDDPEVRIAVARALDVMDDEEIGQAFLDRLVVEPDGNVRRMMLLYDGFWRIPALAFPVLSFIVENDPEPGARCEAAFRLAGFRPQAFPVLLEAAGDPDSSVRRAAVMGLGPIGDVRAIPAIVRELRNPASRNWTRECLMSIQDIVAHATKRKRSKPSPEASAAVQALIDALDAPDWPNRGCKEDHNALPVHATIALYVYALQPDGTVLEMDLDSSANRTEPVTNPLVRFAAVVHGAMQHPELAELIPPPPPHTRPCELCHMTGGGQRGLRALQRPRLVRAIEVGRSTAGATPSRTSMHRAD